ncbi:MAG TPA: hypothetical protein PKU87_02635 [Candidatus Atribacteria bacterium]|nr:hypothetical protein [Candidatus Atribacteria bacterium]HPU08696.1 hypothetical protein [Candidatus Atribacteria bacterium]HPZ81082.1 hypothetical protein [Candidatus Atribacteria bacterium]HQE24563.1 hypothetical protein [Candidatus Atribacteria bacterium]
MLLGILLIVVVLYGLLLFWVLNERLKDLDYLVNKVRENLKEVNDKLTLLLGLEGEGKKENRDNTVEETFSLHSLRGETEKKGEKY